MNWKRFYSIRCALGKELQKKRHLREPLKVLDMGCWDGRLVFQLKEDFYGKYKLKLFGMDLSQRDIGIANQKKKCLDHKDMYFSVMDIRNSGFADEKFDVIILSEVIEHIWEPEKVINQIYLTLKRDGLLILTTPNKGGGIFAKLSGLLKRKRGVNEITPNVISGAGHEHVSVKGKREWNELLKRERFKIASVKGTGGLFFGSSSFDKHRTIFALTVILDVLLEKLPLSHLWSEILFFSLRK
jgi:SAM-dependent methyltransferase